LETGATLGRAGDSPALTAEPLPYGHGSDGRGSIESDDVMEAVQYRRLDRML